MLLQRKGQMSLIMILLVAIALVFYAISFNWGKVSQYKTQVTIAANTGAASLASMMGSYAQNMKMVQLGGTMLKCENTGAAVSYIVAAILLAIAAAILIVATAGAGVAALPAVWAGIATGAGIGGAMALTTAVFIQPVFIQPKLTSLWNKYQQNISTFQDRTLESGLQGMLMSAATDTVMVSDKWDMDMDGRFSGLDPKAKISRLAYYYTQRMRGMPAPKNYLAELQMVLKVINYKLGLLTASDSKEACYYTPSGTNEKILKPQCDPCCLPQDVRPEKRLVNGEIKACSTGVFPAECQSLYAPGCSAAHPEGCWVYDPVYTAPVLAMISKADFENRERAKLKETLGEDDQYDYIAYSNSADTATGIFHDEGVAIKAETPERWRGSDSNGKFFPLLWVMNDTLVDVRGLKATGMSAESKGCHWCASSSVVCRIDGVNYIPKDANGVVVEPYRQLASTTNCVNTFATSTSNPSLVDERIIDGVRGIPDLTAVADDACSESSSGKHWKPGADRFSPTKVLSWNIRGVGAGSALLPEKYEYMNKRGGELFPTGQAVGCCLPGIPSEDPCSCSNAKQRNADTTLWRDDSIDELVQKLRIFRQDSQAILSADAAAQTIIAEKIGDTTETTNSWGDPFLNEDAQVINSKTPDKNGLTDFLATWSQGLERWNNGYAGDELMSVADGFWCLPSSAASLAVKERAAVTAQWGSLESIIQCLEYNAGNGEAFNACSTACKVCAGDPSCNQQPAACQDLPRSLVPSFDPNSAVYKDSCRASQVNSPVAIKYRQDMSQSAALAEWQSRKFAKRGAYLKDLRGRVNEIRTAFSGAEAFLRGNFCDKANWPTMAADGINMDEELTVFCQEPKPGETGLFKNEIDQTPYDAVKYLIEKIQKKKPDMPFLGNSIIYGWYSEPPEGVSKDERGYLHLVKVTAGVPTRSGGSGFSLTGAIPYIHTYTEKADTVRCYELKEVKGQVGTLVVRYDEDHDSKRSGVLDFLSGVPMWQSTFHNPYSGAATKTELSDIENKCFGKFFEKFTTISQPPKKFYNTEVPDKNSPLAKAFMLGLPVDASATGAQAADDCRAAAERLLKRGVGAETCAAYDLSDGAADALKFIPCNHN